MSFAASFRDSRLAKPLIAGAGVMAVVVIVCYAALVTGLHPFHPETEPSVQALFEGVRYIREVYETPRPMVVHVMRIDLTAPGIRFLVTPRDNHSERPLEARTTSEFATEFGVQAGINANYYRPYVPGFLVQGYPRSGHRVEPIGLAAFDGDVYSWRFWRPGVLFIDENHEVSFNRPERYHTMIAGNGFILRRGHRQDFEETRAYPRAALGVDAAFTEMILVVIDGKQPRYSEGATLDELAGILERYGAHNAIRLDEGGSATLVAQQQAGEARVLNRPVAARLPGYERPVANHLGIFARPIQ
ncbi:MAG: phosphodiester glycosidase family protein [Candidatus Hydrogenedentota bacterium]